MKDTTKIRIGEIAERIYRIANFAPEDRDQPLTAIDRAGLHETFEAVKQIVLEQDRDTRHACAEAIMGLTLDSGNDYHTCKEMRDRAHEACMNTQAV